MARKHHLPASRHLATALIAFAVYLASAAGALYWTREAGSIAAVWPSNALVAGLVLYRGRDQLGAAAIALFAASVLIDRLFGFPFDAALGFSFAAAVEVVIVAGLIGKERASANPIRSVRDFVRFLFVAAVLAPFAGSMIAALTANTVLGEPLGPFLAAWYLGAAFGAVLFLTPFVLSLGDTRQHLHGVKQTDWTATFVGLAGLCATALFLPSPYHVILSLGFFIWVGYRWGAFATSAAGLIVALPRLVGHYTHLDTIMYPSMALDEGPLVLQASVSGSIAVSIATVLALRERDTTREDLNIARRQLKEMESLASGTTFQLEVKEEQPGQLSYGASERHFANALGLVLMPSRFSEFLVRVDAEDRDSLEEAVANAIEDVSIFNARFRWSAKSGVRWLRLVALPKTTPSGETVFDGVLLDATERVQSEETKKAQAEQAALVTARSSFLAAASHDLRQPLHALGLYLHTLERRLRDPQDLEIVRSMKTASGAMSEMFTALLDLARIESGTLKPSMAIVSVDTLLREMLPEVLGTRGALQGRLRLVGSSVFVETDPTLLKMVLRNLITNAVKYAPKGRILVGVRRGKERIRILVCDRGPGIKPIDAEHIFDDFYRGSAGRLSSMQGIGLGLAIAKRTSDLLGASLGFSTTQGRGTCFEIGVPRAWVAAVPLKGPEPAYVTPARAGGQRVLIVEDEPAVAASLKVMLSEAGFSPLVATTAQEAVGLIGKGIDGAVIDYQLSGEVSGLDLVDHIRSLKRAATPILLVSGRTDADTVRRFNEAGLRWLAKPIAGDRLVAALFESFGTQEDRPGGPA